MSTPKAYYLLLELSHELKQKSSMQAMYSLQYMDRGEMSRTPTGHTTVRLERDFIMITTDLIERLDKNTFYYLARNVGMQLKSNNLLCHLPQGKTQERAALKNLLDLGLLVRTETPAMYLVNPVKLWKGETFTAVEATKRLLKREGRPRPELIRPLGAKGLFVEQMSAADQFKSLLEEPEAQYGESA